MDWTTCKAHLLSTYPKEGVGYFKKDGSFHPLENKAEGESEFVVDETFLLDEPVLLVHSHNTKDFPDPLDPRVPSPADMQGQIDSGVEWAICVTDGETVNDPVFFGNPHNRPPLVGREFIHCVNDCFELVRDYFFKYGISLPPLPRTHDWFLNDQDYLTQLHEKWGFYKVPFPEMRVGDVIFYQVCSPVPNHLAIYLGNEEVLTHWLDRPSGVESIYRAINSISFVARCHAA